MFAERLLRALSRTEWIVSQRLNPGIKCISSSTCLKYLYDSNNLSYSQANVSKRPYITEFVPHENNHAEMILRKSEISSNTLSMPLSDEEHSQISDAVSLMERDWSSMDNEEFAKNFKILSFYARENQITMEDLDYRGIFKILASRCSSFSDEELQCLLSCLELWMGNRRQIPYIDLSEAVDDECLRRMDHWSVDRLLLINDRLHKLGMIRTSKFSSTSLRTLSAKLHGLSPANLVHLAFLLKVGPKMLIDLQNFEHCLNKCIDRLTAEELGIIAIMFFRYQYSIKSEDLLLKIFRIVQDNVHTISDISLSSCLKQLR